MNRYARRVDANQSEIVKALEAIGVGVVDISASGEGLPDLLCAFRGWLTLLEVKDGSKPPSARKLTKPQTDLHKKLIDHGIAVHVVDSIPGALAVFGVT